jgi:hypothetical protein
MIVYCLPPIDFWAGWQKISDVYRIETPDEVGFYEFRDPDEWRRLWAQAKPLAQRLGWEGDFREGPFVSVLPTGDCDCSILIAWKQDNNGTTFVASPYRLPWLENGHVEFVDSDREPEWVEKARRRLGLAAKSSIDLQPKGAHI